MPPATNLATVAAAQDPADAELVASALRDDAHALELLVRRHYRAAFAVALALMGNVADAEDVCHDALVRAGAKLDECRQPERFGPWLCAIVRNHARNELQRPRLQRTTTITEGTATTAENVARRLHEDELRSTLEAAIAMLPPLQREVVLLHDLHDWSHEAIAESIGTSAGMSRQHLFKARRRLRDALGPDLLREYFDD